MNKPTQSIYDLAVIGGGPSGMMAAGTAASHGLSVILIEKNDSLGKKLLITGGGRCNLTNAEFDNKKFLSKFKDDSKFLFSPFSKFSVKDTLNFFNGRGMETKIEAGNRVFPISNSSKSVFDVMVNYLKENKVTILTSSPIISLGTEKDKITQINLKDKTTIKAKSYILATGGKSHKETGSTGDGFKWLEKIGHTIIEQGASLVPIKAYDTWVHSLSGLSLENIKLTTCLDNKKQNKFIGKILFTHFGLSGPMILNMSKEISELLKYGEVEIELDLMPKVDLGTLDKNLQEVLKNNQNKKIKNSLSEIVHPRLAPIILDISKIEKDKPVNILTKSERLLLVRLIKGLKIKIIGLMGEEKAIITSGGLDLKEVDFKSMSSIKYPNLFVVGDILNIDRPSGGYSLQLCWTTGFVAGESAATYVKDIKQNL
jgi:predicted Rossmann fold flavoprotein